MVNNDIVIQSYWAHLDKWVNIHIAKSVQEAKDIKTKWDTEFKIKRVIE